MLPDGSGVAGAHDVARVARIPLPEDDLAGAEGPRNGHVGDPRQVIVSKRSEGRHALEQRNRVLARRSHREKETTSGGGNPPPVSARITAPINASFIARRNNLRATKRTIAKIATTKIKPVATVIICEAKSGRKFLLPTAYCLLPTAFDNSPSPSS